MKKNIIYYILSILFAVSLAGCEKYLEIPVEAGISEEDIFSTYIGFQGFQPFAAFREGMNIAAVKEAGDLVARVAQNAQGINGARSAAGMEQ